jgi:excisionase family DNA binding protein
MARRKRFGCWLTGIEAAQYLGVDRKTVYNWEQSGLITRTTVPGLARPRFAKANLDSLKEQAAREGVAPVYRAVRRLRDEQGVPDGRRRKSVDA